MNIRKRLAALGVTAAVAVSAVPLTAFAEEESSETVLRFQSAYGTLYFSPSYFEGSGTVENEHLRTLSLALSGSTDVGSGTAGKGLAGDILKQSGFLPEITVYEGIDTDSDPEGIGTIISAAGDDEELGDSDIVVVSVRGLGYGAEWASNLTVGAEGDAAGFKAAAEKVIARIKTYEEDHALSGAKIWLTGYSRGAGVADQVGKYINEHLDEFGITADDLYCYNFAVPRTSATETKYANIHDYVDACDPVPYLLPEVWGLYNTGVVTVLDCPDNEITRKMFNIGGSPLIADRIVDGSTVTVNIPDYLDALVETLANGITRDEFAALSPYINALLPKLMGSDADPAVLQFLKATASGFEFSLSNPAVMWLITAALQPKGSEGYEQAFEQLPAILDSMIAAAGTGEMLPAETIEMIKSAVGAILHAALPVVASDFISQTDIFSTLIGNAAGIIDHHYPDHYFRQIAAMDSYYTKGVDIKPGLFIYLGQIVEDGDEEKIRSLNGTDADLEKIRNGYSVLYTLASYADDSTAISDAEKANITAAAKDSGEIVNIYPMILDSYRFAMFGEADKTVFSGKHDLEGGIVYISNFPELRDDNNSIALFRIKDGKPELINTKLHEKSEDGETRQIDILGFDFDAHNELGDDDYYALVILKPAAEPVPEERTDPPTEDPQPEKQDDNTPKTGTAAACGAAAVILAAVVIASRKRTNAK
ncbi:MAG: hypothetical protein IKP47_02870 [Ruminococcus sp.]|nr:hypothetical protein [Ruminococcus sp.]